jgi:thymidylate synthase
MFVSGHTIDEIYFSLAKALLKAPIVNARGLNTQEIINVQFELLNPYSRFVGYKSRDMSRKYCLGEICYFLDGRNDLESIAHYAKFWNKISDDGKLVNSAYGYRLFNKTNSAGLSPFEYLIEALVRDSSSRKAVMPIYNYEDSRESKDNPCTMHLQFVIRDSCLSCFTFMRSNDVWLGVPYDIAFFTLLQEIVLVRLQKAYPDLKMGAYTHHALSLHVYENNIEALRGVLTEPTPADFQCPRLTTLDIVSWFNDLLTYEKSKRGKVLYKSESRVTAFQSWAKQVLG